MAQRRTKVGCTTRERELGGAKHDLEEDLRVEVEGRGVEGNGLDSRVDVVLCRNTMRGKEVDDLVRTEARITHAREDLVDRVLRERDEVRRGNRRVIRATCEELKLRSADAVAHRHSTGELDAAVKKRT